MEPDLVDHGHLDRADLQDLGAERGHFEHLLERYLVEPAGLGHDAGIGGVDAVDVGVDVAAVGRNRRGERDRGGVRAAAPERRHPVGGCAPLEAGDDRDLARVEGLDQPRSVDLGDAGLAMEVVGEDRDLPPCHERALRPCPEHQREQPGRHQFARGDDGVVFGGVELRARLLAPGDQLVGLAGHRGDDDRDLRAGVHLRFDVRATLRMRSTSATEVPPNFITRRDKDLETLGKARLAQWAGAAYKGLRAGPVNARPAAGRRGGFKCRPAIAERDRRGSPTLRRARRFVVGRERADGAAPSPDPGPGRLGARLSRPGISIARRRRACRCGTSDSRRRLRRRPVRGAAGEPRRRRPRSRSGARLDRRRAPPRRGDRREPRLPRRDCRGDGSGRGNSTS